MLVSKIKLFFHLSIIISLIIIVLPVDYKNAIYTPNILGYIWILLFPIILICYSYLMLKSSFTKKTKLQETTILILFILITVCFWFYQANKDGNL